MTQVTLPGEPKSHGYTNAQAHVDSIVAALALVRLAESATADIDMIDCTVDMVSLLGDLTWNVGDGRMALVDAITEYLIEQPLSITERGHRNSWSDGWEVDYVDILLTTGGPHLHLEVTPDQLVRVIYQDFGSPEHSLPTTEDEREALAWFAQIVAA